MMELISYVLLGSWVAVASSSPLPAVVTESGSGIAPWAGSGPSPEVNAADSRIETANTAVLASSVPVGTIITSCTQPGVVALTFDDGPYIYTSQVLDILRAANNVPATFFVNGNNWQSILTDENQRLIRRMIDEGHQIGSHTWAHPDLTTLDRDGIISQMTLLEDALIQIIGRYPSYMRPPYFATNDLVLRTMGELGYHVVNADIDTLDWANNSPDLIQTSVQRFRDGLNAGGSIALSHDVHQWTANTLVQAMIDEVRNRGLRAVTVGECLGDPAENWYRTN
ncbi:MAG: hypothetical protein Q9217_006367 [Psora testacea]